MLTLYFGKPPAASTDASQFSRASAERASGVPGNKTWLLLTWADRCQRLRGGVDTPNESSSGGSIPGREWRTTALGQRVTSGRVYEEAKNENNREKDTVKAS
ncbi:hypothetical protein MRX96_054948 [Rhipicephalus microplus]